MEGTRPNIYSESGLAMAQTHKCLIVLAAPVGTRKALGAACLCHSQQRGLTVGAGSGPPGAIHTPGWTHTEQAGMGLGSLLVSSGMQNMSLDPREQKPCLFGQTLTEQGRWGGSASQTEEERVPQSPSQH